MPVRHRYLLLALALAIAAVPGVPAFADDDDDDGGHSKKPFQVALAPTSAWAGQTVSGFTVKLTNKAKSQKLGSADVTLPAALTVAGAPSLDRSGKVTASGGVLALRDLSLSPGKTVTVTLGVRMPCAAGVYSWRVVAKQANDFKGEPGNDFGPLLGDLKTTVGGTCALRFVAQPASAERNEQIRAEEFRPASAQLVSVEAVDGSPAPQRLTWFTGDVTLALGPTEDPGQLLPPEPRSTAVAGLASFADLRIDESGNYSLLAATAAAGFTPAESMGFQIIGVVEPCIGSSCTARLAGSNTTSTLTGAAGASNGFALLSLKLGPEPVCAGYKPASTDWYEFALTATRDKTITATYTKAAIKAFGQSVSKLQICFAAPATFTTRTGAAQPFDYDGDPANGAEGFVGLLPDCKYKPTQPCVLKRQSTDDDDDDDDDDRGYRSSDSGSSGGATVKFFVPATWGDPRYRG